MNLVLHEQVYIQHRIEKMIKPIEARLDQARRAIVLGSDNKKDQRKLYKKKCSSFRLDMFEVRNCIISDRGAQDGRGLFPDSLVDADIIVQLDREYNEMIDHGSVLKANH